jgi:hypothetical protein
MIAAGDRRPAFYGDDSPESPEPRYRHIYEVLGNRIALYACGRFMLGLPVVPR